MTAPAASAIVKVWLDQEGILAAAAIDKEDQRAAFLADYLHSDIQANKSTAREWLDWIAAVESERVAEDEGNGNAFSFVIDRDGVELSNEYLVGTPTHRYSFAEVRKAMRQVITVMERRERGFVVLDGDGP